MIGIICGAYMATAATSLEGALVQCPHAPTVAGMQVGSSHGDPDACLAAVTDAVINPHVTTSTLISFMLAPPSCLGIGFFIGAGM
jgi:hypothetical protein